MATKLEEWKLWVQNQVNFVKKVDLASHPVRVEGLDKYIYEKIFCMLFKYFLFNTFFFNSVVSITDPNKSVNFRAKTMKTIHWTTIWKIISLKNKMKKWKTVY